MSQNTNNSKVPAHLLIYLIILFLTPPITALLTIFVKHINQKKKIKNSKNTRVLSLNNITKPINIYDLPNYGKVGSFEYIPYNETNKKYIKCFSSAFFNTKCDKEYYFINDKLDFCNFQMNKSGDISEPKRIFRELRKINGNPDEIYYEKYLSLLQCIWYGKNGSIIYKRYISNMVEITFMLDGK